MAVRLGALTVLFDRRDRGYALANLRAAAWGRAVLGCVVGHLVPGQ